MMMASGWGKLVVKTRYKLGGDRIGEWLEYFGGKTNR